MLTPWVVRSARVRIEAEGGSAIFSACGKHRLRLDRSVAPDLQLLQPGRTFYTDARLVFCGVNPSTAGAEENDHTITKITGFCQRWGIGKFTVINVFTLVSTDVKRLAKMDHTDLTVRNYSEVMEQALAHSAGVVPCWGSRDKLPKALHSALDNQLDFLRYLRARDSLPIYHLGLSKSGDPRHPLMLPYSTPLTGWPAPTVRRRK